MKTLFLFFLIGSFSLFGQSEIPFSWKFDNKDDQIVVHNLITDSFAVQKALSNDSKGKYAVAINEKLTINKHDFYLAHLSSNGDKVYQYRLVSSDMKGFMFTLKFSDIGYSKIWFYNKDRSKYFGPFSKNDLQFDSTILSPILSGNDWIVEVLQPSDDNTALFSIENISAFFRGVKSSAGFGTSDDCMVNVNCNESVNYKKIISSTVKMIVTSGSVSYFCTGNVINNTKLDGTPYVLTANHCSLNSSASDYPNWVFIFSYEFPACANLSVEPIVKQLKGCTSIAKTGSDGGDVSSDFLLLKINANIPDAWNVNYIGWDRSGNSTNSGVCMHHPDGDVKKISSFNTAPTISSYGRITANTHFRVFWASTQSGKGVTQGGSSGSGLINSSGLLIGTLTGGGSSCIDNSLSDFYGRFSMHWDQYGTQSYKRLKPWLDPISSGVTSLGSINKSSISIVSNDDESDIMMQYNNNELIVDSKFKTVSVSIYNAKGQLIESNNYPQGKNVLSTNLLSKGIYFANIVSINNSKSYKFVVQ
jgi:hypothetical protein